MSLFECSLVHWFNSSLVTADKQNEHKQIKYRSRKIRHHAHTNELMNKSTNEPKIFRCLYRRCPPLPIPNREVKPARADGTAVKCGRVGRCQILSSSLCSNEQRLSCFITNSTVSVVSKSSLPIAIGTEQRS